MLGRDFLTVLERHRTNIGSAFEKTLSGPRAFPISACVQTLSLFDQKTRHSALRNRNFIMSNAIIKISHIHFQHRTIFLVVVLFFAVNILIAISSQESKQTTECRNIAKWIERDLNLSAIARGPLIQLTDTLVVKTADRKYARGFLPDFTACRIIIQRECHGLMDCAFLKLKLVDAIYSSGTLQRMAAIISDYDAIILGWSLKDGETYSSLPSHKTWSTALLGFGKNTDIGDAIVTLREVYARTLRDDVAFRAVRAKKENQDIQPTFHVRGRAIPTKDPILAYIIGTVLKLTVISAALKVLNAERRAIKSLLIFVCSFLTSYIVHFIIKLSSVETCMIPDDSDHIWISLPFMGVSIMADFELFIVRHDLYGPYLTGFAAVMSALLSLAEEVGAISIALFQLVRVKSIRKLFNKVSFHRFRSSPCIFNTVWFICSLGLFFISLSSVFGLSEPGGTWKMNIHCNKVKCISLRTPERFFLFTWNYVLLPVVRWSTLVFTSSILLKDKKQRMLVIGGMLIMICLRLQVVSSRAFPGKSIPMNKKSIDVDTCNGTKLSFNVKIPSLIGKVETSKFNVGEGRFVRQTAGKCRVHPNWSKVIWMKAICDEKTRPRSLLFYDDDVRLIHHQDYQKLGLSQDVDATLIEDPHSVGTVVSFLGRFNLDNCSLISAWLREIPCGTHRTLNDQPALNRVLRQKQFSTKKIRVPVLHRDRGSKGFGLKPFVQTWRLSLTSVFILLCGNPNRFDAIEELLFHSVMVYTGGHHLKEVLLQGSSASPYTAVRELMDKRRIVESRPGTYVIFEDYTGRVAELHFSLVSFLKVVVSLICFTNLTRFLISLSSGYFIVSGIDVLTALASENGNVLQRSMARRCFMTYHVVPMERIKMFRLAEGEDVVSNTWIKRKFFIGGGYMAADMTMQSPAQRTRNG